MWFHSNIVRHRGQIKSVFNNLGGDKTLVLFEEAGHESLLNASPERWKDEVVRFLQAKAGRD